MTDYESPKWQKRRLEILKKNGFKCNFCNSEEKQLHVHHIVYQHKRKIWEYEDHQLLVLCNDCHKKLHKNLNFMNAVFTIASEGYKTKILDYINAIFDEF